MPTPRRPLGEIDGNARRGIELSPFNRGQIIATRREGGSWNYIADQLKIARSTIRSTLYANPLRTQGHSLERSGRPPK
jgi:IS30 family transposase